MTRQVNSDLIERAERIAATIDKWGGAAALGNRLDLINELLSKMKAKNDVIMQLDKISSTMFLFKSLLTVDETASYLGVHRNTVNRLIKSHGLPTYATSSPKILILTEELVEWVKLFPSGVSDSTSIPGIQKKKGTRK